MAQVLKLHPAFCLTQSIIFETTNINEIYELRIHEDAKVSNTSLLSRETWHLLNLKGDCLALIGHMIISFLLITLIENRSRLTKYCCKKSIKASSNLSEPDIPKEGKNDDDILNEAIRVSEACPENLTVRVHNLRKDYK